MAGRLSPEEAFYDNLTLGLMKILAKVPRVCNVICEKRAPLERTQLHTWEQRHSVLIPDDMRKFYLSTDGFLLHWSYQYAPNDVRRVGCIQIPHLLEITLLRENIEIPNGEEEEPTPKGPAESQRPHLTSKSKVFELATVNEVAKVCLIFETMEVMSPKVYLLELNTMQWQFLAGSFSEYLRMAIAHLGLPFWQLCFSSFSLPAWTEQLFLLLAPHLIENREPRRSNHIQPASEEPHNTLDPNIFRSKPKSAKAAQKGKH